MTHRIVRSDGIDLAVWETGPRARPTLVFVHGYPDSHVVWDAVIAALEGDFHCVAYDVRGAGASDAPRDVASYRLEKLAADFAHVVDAVSPDRAVHVVGHDWGSIQTWESVCTPRLVGRIASFTSISGPCLDHVGQVLRERLHARSAASLAAVASQVLRSWYIWLFQLPGLADRAWSKGGLDARFSVMLRELEGVEERPCPTRAKDGEQGIALYRANVIPRLRRPATRTPHAPVQLVVATKDRYVQSTMLDDVSKFIPDLERHAVDAGHWVVLAQPARIAGLVRDFVTRVEARERPTRSA